MTSLILLDVHLVTNVPGNETYILHLCGTYSQPTQFQVRFSHQRDDNNNKKYNNLKAF